MIDHPGGGGVEAIGSDAGVGALRGEHIERGDRAAWDEIKRRIDYTYENLDLALAPLEAHQVNHLLCPIQAFARLNSLNLQGKSYVLQHR